MKAYPFVKYGFKMFSGNEVKEMLLQAFKEVTILESDEPSQIVNDQEISVQSLVISAHKK